MGDLLKDRLAELPGGHVTDIRGLGLMIGVEMDQEVKPIIEAGYGQGVILLNAGPNVLRLVPPLIVTEVEIARLISALTHILGN
jgi:acetylornithine/succinyldiaminopimelate/putrescine aminotransferase